MPTPRARSPSPIFRPPTDFSPIDREALGRCSGRVLDVGAAAGAVTLPLQERGLEVTALDPVPDAVRIMRNRGVLNARLGDVMTFRSDELFDTVLLLMNGSMIAGTLAGLERMLLHLETLLSPGGQVLMDSTDLRDGPEVRGRRFDYGYGWMYGESEELGRWISHDGGQSGTSTDLFILRDHGIAVAILANVARQGD